jgi:hypothetical protein
VGAFAWTRLAAAKAKSERLKLASSRRCTPGVNGHETRRRINTVGPSGQIPYCAALVATTRPWSLSSFHPRTLRNRPRAQVLQKNSYIVSVMIIYCTNKVAQSLIVMTSAPNNAPSQEPNARLRGVLHRGLP